jgi:hypothetical protein
VHGLEIISQFRTLFLSFWYSTTMKFNIIDFTCMLALGIRVSEKFDKIIVSAWKIAVSMILCNGRPACSFGSPYRDSNRQPLGQ